MEYPRTQLGDWLRAAYPSYVGPVKVSLSLEYTVDLPIELVATYSIGFVGADALGITPELERDLKIFHRWWCESVDAYGDEDEDEADYADAAEFAAWRRDGDRLIERLRTELGSEFAVGWAGEPSGD